MLTNCLKEVKTSKNELVTIHDWSLLIVVIHGWSLIHLSFGRYEVRIPKGCPRSLGQAPNQNPVFLFHLTALISMSPILHNTIFLQSLQPSLGQAPNPKPLLSSSHRIHEVMQEWSHFVSTFMCHQRLHQK